MSKYTLELTEEELQFIYDRCSNKAARLEEVNLKDKSDGKIPTPEEIFKTLNDYILG